MVRYAPEITMNRIKLNNNGSQTRSILNRVHWAAVKELSFKATGTDKLKWFSKDKLREPLPWENVKSEEQNSFSIKRLTNRNFFINRNYGGCHIDAG